MLTLPGTSGENSAVMSFDLDTHIKINKLRTENDKQN